MRVYYKLRVSLLILYLLGSKFESKLKKKSKYNNIKIILLIELERFLSIILFLNIL